MCKCSSCGCEVVLKEKREGRGFFLSCQGFPDCRVCVWLPDTILSVVVLEETCNQVRGRGKGNGEGEGVQGGG